MARQAVHLAIAAKYLSIFSGYWQPGKQNIFFECHSLPAQDRNS
jgi:hypothetical protein